MGCTEKQIADRELLEMAAKAAGLNTPRYVIDGRQLGWAINEGISTESGLTSHRLWNPLIDDGDALRLAVKLSIRIYPPEPHLYGRNSDKASTSVFGKFWEESDDAEPYAATRRAITRAAAEIGRSMK